MECRCPVLDGLHGVEGEEYARNHLVTVVVDDSNWQTLYRCPVTGVYWKKFFPQGELHGGGPPELLKIDEEAARREFRF